MGWQRWLVLGWGMHLIPVDWLTCMQEASSFSRHVPCLPPFSVLLHFRGYYSFVFLCISHFLPSFYNLSFHCCSMAGYHQPSLLLSVGQISWDLLCDSCLFLPWPACLFKPMSLCSCSQSNRPFQRKNSSEAETWVSYPKELRKQQKWLGWTRCGHGKTPNSSNRTWCQLTNLTQKGSSPGIYLSYPLSFCEINAGNLILNSIRNT